MSSKDRGIFVKKNGKWVEVSAPSVRATLPGGTPRWNDLKAGYVKENGVWYQFYPSAGTEFWICPAPYTFKVPPGIREITVNMSAGGGGGGGGTAFGSGSAGGGGGSGGYYVEQKMKVVPGETLTIGVGAGGLGAAIIGETSQAPQGGIGGASTVRGRAGQISASGGSPGIGGYSTRTGGSGGGGGCCVISSALAEKQIWSQRDKFDLIDWCEKYLHNTWWGETFRRGYQVLGSKLVVPHMKRNDSLWSKYITWAFNNGTKLVRGKKFAWLSLPSTIIWISGFMIVGAVVTKNYATKCWVNLYRRKK